MVTYGVAMALVFTYLAAFPSQLKWMVLGITFGTTALLPGSAIALLAKSGAVQDISLSNRRDRAVPYLFFLASLLLCLFFFRKMMMPFWLISILAGSGVALVVALLVNFAWKISAHAIGIGGLIGGLMGVSRIYLMNPYPAFILLILLAGLLGTSRLYLQKHTPWQVYAGFCLGFICTFASALLSYIYLFI